MTDNLEQAQRRVGIEVSNSAYTAVCLERDDSISAAKRVATDPEQPTAVGIAGFINEIRQDFGHFDRIGVAVPGLVGSGTGRVVYSANIPQHSDIDLASEIRSATGLTALIEACDAMLKSANVTLIGWQKIGSGLVTALVVGDVAAVKAAVDAGAAAAGRIGEVVGVQVIPRPHEDLASVLPGAGKKAAASNVG